MTLDFNYSPNDLIPYIDWPHFLFAWGFKGMNMHTAEAQELQEEALTVVAEMQDGGATIRCRVRILDAHREGDDLVVYASTIPLRIPCLRQQVCDKGSNVYRCLADYLAPAGLQHPIGNRIGVFATATHVPALSQPLTAYRKMMLQTLADRLAEAAAERVHHEALHQEWGKPFAQPIYGIRPAVGYPSLPDMSVNFVLEKILDFNDLGIRLTENGMMIPHAAVSGFIFAHPEARYFNVGLISEEQFLDYARRKEVAPQALQKFIPQVVKTT